MTTYEEYGRCRACGAVCDGDVCDWACENALQAELDAKTKREHAEDDAQDADDSELRELYRDSDD
jgi:hypothetical protein